ELLVTSTRDKRRRRSPEVSWWGNGFKRGGVEGEPWRAVGRGRHPDVSESQAFEQPPRGGVIQIGDGEQARQAEHVARVVAHRGRRFAGVAPRPVRAQKGKADVG